jgi:hypothetical protein
MKAKNKKNPSRLRSRTKKAVSAPESTTPQDQAAQARFVQDLAVRGEAAKIAKDGKLPAEATHVITKTNPDGTIQVKRARFKFA